MRAPAITPPAAKLQKWRRMRDDNLTTEELVDMARWLLRELHKRPRPSDALSERCGKYLNVFLAIQSIHLAEGCIPYRVYQYRYDTMNDFVGFAGSVSAGLYNALHGCL